MVHKGFQPITHGLATPAGNGTLVYTHAFVGENEVLVNSQYPPKTFTALAGAIGVVEAKKVDTGLLEEHAIQLKLVGKGILGFPHDVYHTTAQALKKGGLHGITKAVAKVFVVMLYCRTINQHQQLAIALQGARFLQQVFQKLHLSIYHQAGVAFLQQYFQLLLQAPPFGKGKGREDHQFGAFIMV